MRNLTNSELEFIVERVLSNAKEAFDDKDNSDFTNGKKLAYYEILDTIKNELINRDIDISAFRLDIDLEKLLLEDNKE